MSEAKTKKKTTTPKDLLAMARCRRILEDLSSDEAQCVITNLTVWLRSQDREPVNAQPPLPGQFG